MSSFYNLIRGNTIKTSNMTKIGNGSRKNEVEEEKRKEDQSKQCK